MKMSVLLAIPYGELQQLMVDLASVQKIALSVVSIVFS